MFQKIRKIWSQSIIPSIRISECTWILKDGSLSFAVEIKGLFVGSPVVFVDKISCTCMAALCMPGKVSHKRQPDACISFKLCTVLKLINSRFLEAKIVNSVP